ncbi:hypothetical protein [Xenorhabdus sp. BG5]|uniref:hypothetical protein n=1 Tax=Xenorhabdus sp. BG5 TaxID=2782014 RepID=UPI001D14A71F|nr:hypothetical protein [Xenorhabdus sp. BG5]
MSQQDFIVWVFCWVDETGVVTGFTLTPTNVSEREATWDVIGSIKGYFLGDKGYLCVEFKQEIRTQASK